MIARELEASLVNNPTPLGKVRGCFVVRQNGGEVPRHLVGGINLDITLPDILQHSQQDLKNPVRVQRL
jgi:hypothetical protein